MPGALTRRKTLAYTDYPCIDIVERFQLSLMLVAIALRNLIELSGSEDFWTKDAVLPKAFNLGRGSSLLWATFSVSAQLIDPSLPLRTLPGRLRAVSWSWRLVLISYCVLFHALCSPGLLEAL